jgi:hypothetical protein
VNNGAKNMPTISIETFFACSLMVSVVIISAVLSAGILDSHISRMQDLNEQEYFRAISEHILFTCGKPENWGSDGAVLPQALGLAKADSPYPKELDIDKICRLNSQNNFSLTYPDILNAARMDNIALGIRVTNLLDVNISLASNVTDGDSMRYTFLIHVSQETRPVTALLHSYVVARNFLNDSYASTGTDGLGYSEFAIPNASNGTTLLVVFARATFDPRATSSGAYAFAHLSDDPDPNNTFLRLSPLNHTLYVEKEHSDVVLDNCYAFTYEHNLTATSTSDLTYRIPALLESSPIAVTVTGYNASTFFIEWTFYPQTPLVTGASFASSECYAFEYTVTVRETFYKVFLSFGGLSE